jgi:hypothetical protein
MPQPSTFVYVADLVIRRVLEDLEPGADVREAMEQAYPFENTPEARIIWMDALLRNCQATD